MDKMYQFKQSDSADTTELLIHGDIVSYKWFDSDIGSFDLAMELEKVTTPNLLVRINSYGGEASQGLGIYHLLKAFKGRVTTIIDGVACSAASVIFMAGTERIMPKSTLLFIHNAWTYGEGDSNDFKKLAEDLEKITQPSVEIFKSVSNLSEVQIKKMMDDETWLSADEALVYGFATSIKDDVVKQSLEQYHVSKLVKVIERLKKEVAEKTVVEEPQPKDAWTSFFNGKKGN